MVINSLCSNQKCVYKVASPDLQLIEINDTMNLLNNEIVVIYDIYMYLTLRTYKMQVSLEHKNSNYIL